MASKSSPGSITGLTCKRPAEGDGEGDKRQKLSFGISKPSLSKPGTAKPGGLQIKLNAGKSTGANPLIKKTSVFNDESDEEPEEMPPEARMRMRNIGRDTPTSAGPNSFGKTKQGFCNVKKVYEKHMTAEAETLATESSKDGHNPIKKT